MAIRNFPLPFLPFFFSAQLLILGLVFLKWARAIVTLIPRILVSISILSKKWTPLLANIYLNLVDKLVREHSVFKDVHIVRYADDFVLMGKKIDESVMNALSKILERMELELNIDKTRLIRFSEQSFNFLGFTFHK